MRGVGVLTFLPLQRVLAASIETLINILLGFLGAKPCCKGCESLFGRGGCRKDYVIRGETIRNTACSMFCFAGQGSLGSAGLLENFVVLISQDLHVCLKMANIRIRTDLRLLTFFSLYF